MQRGATPDYNTFAYKNDHASGDQTESCGDAMVESKIKGAAGFRVELAMPGVFMRQRGFWRGEKRRIGAISTMNAAAHAEGVDFRTACCFATDAAK